MAGPRGGASSPGSAASLAVLVVFWDRQLVLGVLIDLAIVAVAVVQPAFTGRLG